MESTVRSITEMFGLTTSQIHILYSLEHLLTKQDIRENPKDIIYKEHWLERWSACLQSTVQTEFQFLNHNELLCAIQKESAESVNQTWFYLIMLEGSLFQAYTSLGETKDEDKHYAKLKYKSQNVLLKEIAQASGIMNPLFIDRFQKAYQKSLDKISGKVQRITLSAVSVVAVSAIAAATAGTLAGPVAVALFGSNFVGLSGAALTSACLAMAGGGAIAAGGAGMAGGVAAIVGGGALLGAAGGGAAVSAANLFVKALPSFALSQAAKLEVVLKEIILNAQEDIQSAQVIMDELKQQIHTLQKEMDDLILENEENKSTRKNMEKAIAYLRKAYQDMAKFKTSYEIGLENANG